MSSNKANKLLLVDNEDVDKENMHENKIRTDESETTFHQLTKPTLSIQRKYLQKIERDIGIRKNIKVESSVKVPNEKKHKFKTTNKDKQKKPRIDTNINKANKESSKSTKKTVDLFAKAKEAIHLQENKSPNILKEKTDAKDHPKMREIQPMQKRTGYLRRSIQGRGKKVNEEVKSPKSS